MGLIGQTTGGGHLGSGQACGQPALGALQADGHQHLLGSDVKAGLEAALEVVGAEVHCTGQLGQGNGASETGLHIVDGAAQRVGRFARGRQGPGMGAQGLAHPQQQAVGGELAVTVPEGIQGRLQDGGSARIASHGIGEIPVALAADGLEPVGGQVEHAIAPPLLAG